MAIDIVVPELGESVTEGTVGVWLKQIGDAVHADEPLVELETDKATLEISAPKAGVLVEILVPEGEDVEIGIDGHRMTIEATREETSETEDDGYRSEFHYGHFHRMMTLPEGADTDAVTANYTDGILEIRVPVHTEPETTTKVPVTRA